MSGYAAASCTDSCFGMSDRIGVSGFECNGTEGTLLQCGDPIQTQANCMQHAGVLCCKLCYARKDM